MAIIRAPKKAKHLEANKIILVLAVLIVSYFLIISSNESAINPTLTMEPCHNNKTASTSASSSASSSASTSTSESTSTSSFSTNEKSFKEIALKTGTDKVAGYTNLEPCLLDPEKCTRKECEREECRTWGHFYDTIYDKWMTPYSSNTAEQIQFLEIGFYNGKGFEAYSEFLPRAEMHSMEISCLPPGSRSEGKWPEEWGNFAKKSENYDVLRMEKRLHCGDASDYEFLNHIWTTEMKRPDAPPLKIVVDDASHLSKHITASLFFWLPRIEPGGILVIEDIQPTKASNEFRTHILPQVMKDLHWCGNDLEEIQDTRCFPTIQPLLAGVHCEMHICVFQRNDSPSLEPNMENSVTPDDAFSNAQKCLFGTHK